MMEVDNNEDKDPVEAPVLQMNMLSLAISIGIANAIVMKIREDPPV